MHLAQSRIGQAQVVQCTAFALAVTNLAGDHQNLLIQANRPLHLAQSRIGQAQVVQQRALRPTPTAALRCLECCFKLRNEGSAFCVAQVADVCSCISIGDQHIVGFRTERVILQPGTRCIKLAAFAVEQRQRTGNTVTTAPELLVCFGGNGDVVAGVAQARGFILVTLAQASQRKHAHQFVQAGTR